MDTKYALITGGSSGIGLSYAKEVAKHGFTPIIVSNREQEGKDAAKQIPGAIAVYKDLSQYNAAEELINEYPDIELLINNAGIFFYNDVLNCSMERIETIINLHIITTVKLCKLYGEQMKDRKSVV